MLGSQVIKAAFCISYTLVERDISGREVGLGAPCQSICHPGAAREPTALCALRLSAVLVGCLG